MATAAHELKTPLTNLRGFVYALQTTLNDPGAPHLDRVDRSLRVIDDQSEKLNHLVCNLLDLSRIEQNQLLLDLAPVDLGRLVADVCASIQLRATRHALHVSTSGAFVVMADALRLEQVLVNLLGNAMRFSPDGGAIEIDVCSEADDSVCISVRDHGIGVPEEQRSHLFQRLGGAHADEYRSGLGLGVYISRSIVELHRGTIEASFPDDGGARFTITLPRLGAA